MAFQKNAIQIPSTRVVKTCYLQAKVRFIYGGLIMALISGVSTSLPWRPPPSPAGRLPAQEASAVFGLQAVLSVPSVGTDSRATGQLEHPLGQSPQTRHPGRADEPTPFGVVLDDIPCVNDAAILSDDVVKPQPPSPNHKTPDVETTDRPARADIVKPGPKDDDTRSSVPLFALPKPLALARVKPTSSEAWEESLRIIRPTARLPQTGAEPEEPASA